MNPLVTVVCQKMIQFDCLSSLIAIIQKYSNYFQTELSENETSEALEITELLVNTISLFTNLWYA